MRKFSIALLMIFLFTFMPYAQAQDDPCAKFTNPKEKSICNNMMPGLNAYKDNFVKEHSRPFADAPTVPESDSGSRYRTIKLPPVPGQEPGVTIQQQKDTNNESKRRNIFQ